MRVAGVLAVAGFVRAVVFAALTVAGVPAVVVRVAAPPAVFAVQFAVG